MELVEVMELLDRAYTQLPRETVPLDVLKTLHPRTRVIYITRYDEPSMIIIGPSDRLMSKSIPNEKQRGAIKHAETAINRWRKSILDGTIKSVIMMANHIFRNNRKIED